MTLLSVIGMVALTGIVVNDSLILVDFINKAHASGASAVEAVIEGAKRRFRPILLTTLTTILGLAPIMTETSFQARFLIPMAIAISFGVAFATFLTLLLTPAVYMIVEDARRLTRWLWYGSVDEPTGAPELPS
jgi:multidrug efflux pump subunit AcrB